MVSWWGSFIVDVEPTRVLVLAAPSGFEQFALELGVPAIDDRPPSDLTVPDPETLGPIAERYGIEIVGPPLRAPHWESIAWLEEQGATIDIIDRHFAAENAHDVTGTLATYTDDIVWDDVTHPDAPFHGKEAVGSVYSSIIGAIPDVKLESVKRFKGEDGRFVVDESILTGHVEGEWAGMDGGGAPVEVRILHIFEVRDGLISYENAWFDAANVQRQIIKAKASAD